MKESYKTLEANLGSQRSELERRTSGVVCREDGSSTLAVESTTTIDEDDDGESERVPSFLTEFPNIVLRFTKKGDE